MDAFESEVARGGHGNPSAGYEGNAAIIIDNGCGSIKAGLSSEETPSLTFPSIIGRPRSRYADSYDKHVFVGDDATAQLDYMSISYPIDHGHIDDWIDVKELWSHAFTKLRVDPSEHPVLLTEPPLCSSRHREKIGEILFEEFGSPEINISVTGLMAIYATGKLTGLVLDIGEGVTECVPVIEGFVGRGSVKRSDMGGQELTLFLKESLCERGYALTTREEYDYVQNIKETLCYCSMDPAADAARTDQTVTYVLPDGKVLRDGDTSEITLGPERIYPAEALFNPELCKRDVPMLTDVIWRAVLACPLQSRKDLLGSLFICGGSTMFPGFGSRLEDELKNTAPPQARHAVRVLELPNRKNLVWLGASVFVNSISDQLYDQIWIKREEWNDVGSRIVHIKAALK